MSLAATAAGAGAPAAAPTLLTVDHLTMRFGALTAIDDLSFTAHKGDITAIIGPNGAGKSTLLKAALGLVKPLSGHVSVFGKDLARQRHRIAYVPQRASVDWDFPTRVIDVVLMGLYRELGLLNRIRSAHGERAMACRTRVGMQDFATRQIGQLSGGQQQRVFLARALAQQSDLYLMDEPFAGVDASTESAIIGLLRDLRDEGKTVFVVHHDLSTVPDYFDWVILLNARLIAYGPTKDTFTTENLGKTYGGQLTVMAEVAEALRKDDGLDATTSH